MYVCVRVYMCVYVQRAQIAQDEVRFGSVIDKGTFSEIYSASWKGIKVIHPNVLPDMYI